MAPPDTTSNAPPGATRPAAHVRGALARLVLVLTWVYAVFSLIALAALVLDAGDDPLAGILLVLAAMPWTPLLGGLLDLSGRAGSPWLAAAVLCAGVAVNLALLLGLGRLLRRRPRP